MFILFTFLFIFTLTSFSKTYYCWKKSLSGIVLGTAMMLVSILSISAVSYYFDLSLLALNWIETGSFSEAIKGMQASKSHSKIITIVLALISSAGVFYLGVLGIKNYNGPIRQSEWKAKNGDSDNEKPLLLRLLLSDILFTFKSNEIVFESGVNPFKIEPNNKVIHWRELSLDLLTTSNSDISPNKSKWSALHNCYICERTNYVTDSKSKIFFFPLSSVDSIAAIEASYDEALKVSSAEDEFLFCCEDNEAFQKFNGFSISKKITNLSKIQLIQGSMDVKNYAKYILKRFEETIAISYEFVDINGTESTKEITLNNTFITPKLYERGDKKKVSQDFDKILNSWLKSSSAPQLSFLGEFGQGKSTVLLEYCARWAKKCLASGDDKEEFSRIPLLIELRGRSPKSFPTPEAMLGDWGQKYGFTGKQLLNLVKSKMAVLIFEGFDEVKDAGNKLERYRQFNALWKYAFQGSKVLFTGRPNFFFNEGELNEFLNVNDSLALTGSSTSKIYHFNFMNSLDIKKMMRHVEPCLAGDILSVASNDSSLMDIAKRPSMLPVVLSQWKKIKDSKISNEPVTPAQIVDGYIKASYIRKEEKELEYGAYQKLPWEIRHFVTKAIAQWMLTEKSKNTISAVDIDHVAEKSVKYFSKVFLCEEAPQKLKNAITELNLSKVNNNEKDSEIAEKIASDVRSNGLLAPDPASGTQNFYFPHKQFYEYILGENFAGFHSATVSQESIALKRLSINSFKGSRRCSLSSLMRLEPMSFIYFSGLFSTKFIKAFEPAISPSKFLKIFRPYLNLVEFFNIKLLDRFNPMRNSFLFLIEEAILSPTHKKKEKVVIKHSLKSFIEFFIFTVLSFVLGFIAFYYIIFFKCEHSDSLRIKFILMRLRCNDIDIDKKFGNSYFRANKEKWFKRNFIDIH